uniref:Uncharacterized protein n=1 Tax=Arundo donax TaxID=35708 RepID=A0A0A9B8Z6_ARUDO
MRSKKSVAYFTANRSKIPNRLTKGRAKKTMIQDTDERR